MTQAHLDRDSRVRDAIYHTRLLVNRTPHFSKQTRREANRALDILEAQLGLNQVNAVEAARAIELLNRAHAVAHLRPAAQRGLRRSLRAGTAAPRPARHRRSPGRGARRRSWRCRFLDRSARGSTATTCPTDDRVDAEGRPAPAAARLLLGATGQGSDQPPARAWIRLASVGVEPRPRRSPTRAASGGSRIGRAQRLPRLARRRPASAGRRG